jgi:hypothetical protein
MPILSTTVPLVTIRELKKFQSLGYICKCGDTINAKIEHLSRGSAKKIKCQCDDCGDLFEREYFQLISGENKVYSNKILCKSCIRIISGGIRINIYNSSKGKSAFSKYRTKVSRLTRKTYEKFKESINPNNLPRTRCGKDGGHQLDHKISVGWGFKWGINPIWIAAKENLQIIPWRDNCIKR